MTNKTFEITGVTLKTELKVSFLFGICFVFFWVASVYLYYTFNHLESIVHIPFYIFFGAMFVGFAWGLFVARILGRKMRIKYLFEISEESLKIKSSDNFQSYTFDYINLKLVSLVGTAGSMRFFKIVSEDKTLKIRLGTYGLAPFSEKIDIQTMDTMISDLEPILKKVGFIDKKVNTPNNVFEYRYLK
jgi:hypothetical protein